MRHKKNAPTGQGQGRISYTSISYHNAHRLSRAAEIILLALQAPDHANHLYNQLDQTLRAYYNEGRAKA